MIQHPIETPDTLYLPDRAALAINALVGCLNPEKDALPFCLVDLTGAPPRMRHTQFDYSDHTSRVIDALLSAQHLTGSQEGDDALADLLPLFWAGFAEDGLHYTPDNPWTGRHANMHYQRSVLNALISLIKFRNDDRAREQAKKLVRGLHSISIWRDGFAYFPSVEYLPDGWPRGDWGILGYGIDPANTNGRLIYGLVELAELTGDKEARELAAGYVEHVMHHSAAFQHDGSFSVGMEFREGHFHSRALTMLGVIRYGVTFGDAAAVEWGRRVFERAKQYGTAFGWFPERVEKSQAFGCETCAVVDMLEAAMWLGKAGHVECWQDAERFLRNQLVESQLLDDSSLQRTSHEARADEWETTVDVARRSVGGFAGWSMPNDFVAKVMHDWDLYTCCSAQGVRGLLNAWTEATTTTDREITVNLLLTKIDETVIVRSWLPVEGRIEVSPLVDADVLVRIPGWADRRQISVTVDGSPTDVIFSGHGYLRVRDVSSEQTVSVRFEVTDHRMTQTVLDVDYTTEWAGDTVRSIEPSGARFPLYASAERSARAVTTSVKSNTPKDREAQEERV